MCIKINGRKWFKCDHVTILMRKVYNFRMIGKRLYCAPKPGFKQEKKS